LTAQENEEEEGGEEFAFCPPEYPWAHNDGEQCCDERIDVNYIDYDTNKTLCAGEIGDGEGIDCNEAISCSDFYPTCYGYNSISGDGFPDPKYNVAYEPLVDENESAKLNETIYVQISHRVVFGEKDFDESNPSSRKCLYWELETEQWRLGQCLALGPFSSKFNCVGYTLKVTKLEGCVVDQVGWVSPCNEEESLEEAKLVGIVTFSSGASDVTSQTATASLSYVKTNSGSFKPKCKWRFRRGSWKCVKGRGKGKRKKNKENQDN